MLGHILSFERRLLLRNGVFWIVMLVFALLGFGSMASDNVSFGGGVGNIMRNAPAVVISLLGTFSVLAVLLTTIFVAGIALRDFEQRTAELFFATPMRKRDYLLGRFGGGFLASLAILVAVAFGLWLGSLMPWLDQARLGPTPWSAYAWAFGVLVVPNLLFLSALLFLLATLTRSMLYPYIGVIAFFVLWAVSGFLPQDLDSGWIGALLWLGVAGRVGVFPFHGWVPVFAERLRSPVASMTVVSPFGLLLALRVCLPLLPQSSLTVASVVLPCAALSSAYGALIALGQDHGKRQLGFLWISVSGAAAAGLTCSRTSDHRRRADVSSASRDIAYTLLVPSARDDTQPVSPSAFR